MGWVDEAVSAGVGAAGGIMGAERGASLDYKYGLKREAELWKRGQERGLTPQEYYGSPAPGGAANFSSGAGQTMGNSLSKAGQQMSQMIFQAEQNDADRETQKTVAETYANASTRGQDIQADTAANALALSEKIYNEVTKKQAAAQLKLSEQQLQKLIHDTTTASPQFVEMMKKLGMGTENVYVELMTRAAGVKSFDDFTKLSPDKQTELINSMLAGGSQIRKEVYGVSSLAGDGIATLQKLASEFGIDVSNDKLLKEAQQAYKTVLRALELFNKWTGSNEDASNGIVPKERGPTMGKTREDHRSTLPNM